MKDKERFYQTLGLLLTIVYGVFIFWIYTVAPSNFDELKTKAQQTIEETAIRTKLLTNTYEIDEKHFEEGLKAFRNEDFTLARNFFEQADPAKRSAKVQFYIAYSLYRQGWGRFSNDDKLFQQALKVTDLVIQLDRNYKTDDPDLKLKTPFELKKELEEGLKITLADFNPLKILRERK